MTGQEGKFEVSRHYANDDIKVGKTPSLSREALTCIGSPAPESSYVTVW